MTARCPHCKKFIKTEPAETVLDIRYETRVVYVRESALEKIVAWACLTTIFLLLALAYITGGQPA